MQNYLKLGMNQKSMRTVEEILPKIINNSALHARFINSLSRMEYVGVRKMLKSRDADSIDYDGLLHVIEESSHAIRLKKAAIKINKGEEFGIKGYSESETLAGKEAENYLQKVDRLCERNIQKLNISDTISNEANYILSSVIIEIRADCFYPIYEKCLREAEMPFSVSSIVKDEIKHLAEMSDRAMQIFGSHWPNLLEESFLEESILFENWANSIKAATMDTVSA